MFVKGEDDDDNRTAFQKTLHCVKNVLMSKIISSDKDLVGVILFGTGKTNNSSDFPNVYDLQCLDMPGADRILQLEEMMKSETIESDHGGHSDSFALSDALWYVDLVLSAQNLYTYCRVSTRSGNLLEGQVKSGKSEIFTSKLG